MPSIAQWFRCRVRYLRRRALWRRTFETAIATGNAYVARDMAKTVLPQGVTRELISQFLVGERMTYGLGALLTAAKVALHELRDPNFVATIAYRAAGVEQWRDSARIWKLIAKDPAIGAHASSEMARAIRMYIPRAVSERAFTEATFVVEPFLPPEEKKDVYRELYEILLEVEPLEAAYLARRKPGMGFTPEDVRRAAIAAYWKAREEPSEPPEGDTDPRPDHELIVEEFNLSEGDVAHA